MKFTTMDKKYVVYQHVTPDGMYYFGQTQNVEKRWRGNGIGYKGTALYPYIEQYGWENIKHIVLFRDQTKEDALWIEDFLIETAREDGVCINKQRSGNISKEEGYQQRQSKQYREQHEDKIKEYQSQYYEQNRDKIKERTKQYYEQNKDKIREYQQEYQQTYQQEYYEQNKDKKKEYREQNKDKISNYQREYREQHKEEYNEYQREYQRKYRQRKKQESKFKEFGYIPLF